MNIQQRANVKKWVKALESGKYKQGKFFLKNKWDETSHRSPRCCLGVACDVFKLTEEQKISNANIRTRVFKDLFGPNLMQGYFIKLNDKMGYNFKQIAKVIRQQTGVK